MFWLLFLLAWTAVAIVAGVLMGAAVRRADQLESPDPHAGLLVPEQRSSVPF
jgi:hypothetical protein